MTRLDIIFRPLYWIPAAIYLVMPMFGMAAPTTPSMPIAARSAISFNAQSIELTLEDAVLLGLRDNRSIRGAYLSRISQKFDLRVAEDSFTPKMVISARHLIDRNQSDRYQQSELIPQTTLLTPYGTRLNLAWSNQLTVADQAGRSRNDGATLSVIQPLLRGAGRNVVNAPITLARLAEKNNRLILKSTVASMVTGIITSYREVVRSQEQLQLAVEALNRSRKLLDTNKELIKAGRMAAFEIVQSEADIANQELAVEEAKNQLDSSRLALLKLLALDLHTQFRAVENITPQPISISYTQALSTAQEKQPAYLQQLIAVERSKISLAVARDQRKWDVSLVAGATQIRDRYMSDNSRFNSRSWDSYVGIQIDIPIGDLSSRQVELAARVDSESQELRLLDGRQLLEQDVSNAVRDVGTRWRQYEIALRAQDLSRRKLEIEREKLKVGRSSNFQVISFETDLRNVENARLNTLIAYLNAQATLDQTLGTTLDSWEIDLND